MKIERRIAPAEPIRFHDFANLFPWMDSAAMDQLREDIRQRGVLEPIVMLGNAILDGRNRYQCARDLGVEYPVRQFDPATEGDPLAWVISHNLHRRHLSESQRAAVAAKIANMGEGRPKDNSANLPSFLPPDPALVSTATAAKMLNVSERSVTAARKVQTSGVPELQRAVETGNVSVSAAAKLADLPKPEQAKVFTPEAAASKKALQRSVLAAVADARKPVDRKNHDRVPDPFHDQVLTFIDHCEQLAKTADLDRIAAYDDPRFQSTVKRMRANAAAALAVLARFKELTDA